MLHHRVDSAAKISLNPINKSWGTWKLNQLTPTYQVRATWPYERRELITRLKTIFSVLWTCVFMVFGLWSSSNHKPNNIRGPIKKNIQMTFTCLTYWHFQLHKQLGFIVWLNRCLSYPISICKSHRLSIQVPYKSYKKTTSLFLYDSNIGVKFETMTA